MPLVDAFSLDYFAYSNSKLGVACLTCGGDNEGPRIFIMRLTNHIRHSAFSVQYTKEDTLISVLNRFVAAFQLHGPRLAFVIQ